MGASSTDRDVMTRPAIMYDTTLTAPGTVYRWYDRFGRYQWSGSYTQALEGRRMSKPASIKTQPGPKGKYYLPTDYASKWSRVYPSAGGFHLTVYTNNVGPNQIYRCEIDGTGVTSSSLSRDPPALYPIPPSIWNRLEIKALNKLRNQKVNFGVALAEAKETARLFSDNTRRISDSVKLARTREPKAFAMAKKFCGTPNWRKVPSAWLEYAYGWNPLMSDVLGAAYELERDLGDYQATVIVKSGAKVQDTVRLKMNGQYCTFNQSISCKGDVKVKLAYRLSNFVLAELSRLGLANPLEIAWERVPYSFVVDWFLPVGEWLSALSGDFGYSFQNGHRSTYVRMEENCESITPAASYRSPLGGGMSGSHGYFQRSSYVSSPWPTPYFKSPVSSTHIANSLSLLASSFSRRLK